MLENDPFRDLAGGLRWAIGLLTKAGVASPDVDARLLAGHLMGLSIGQVSAKAVMGTPVPDGFVSLVEQRARRVPLQHLTGRAYFRSLELRVGPGVFIPRPETETLVEVALTHIRKMSDSGQVGSLKSSKESSGGQRVVDLGTGSAAIPLAIAFEEPNSVVYAVEKSTAAFRWASINRRFYEKQGVQVDVRCGDLAESFSDLNGTIDVVVSNPPYIPDDAVPQEREVALYDPEMALYGGGKDGLEVPRQVVRTALRLLQPGGLLAMEHGAEQGAMMRELLSDVGFSQVVTIQDLAGRDRVVSGILSK